MTKARGGAVYRAPCGPVGPVMAGMMPSPAPTVAGRGSVAQPMRPRRERRGKGSTLENFRAIQWRYAPQDSAARAELARRIAEAWRREHLITYSDLVKNVTFTLPSLREPKHRILQPPQGARPHQELQNSQSRLFVG